MRKRIAVTTAALAVGAFGVGCGGNDEKSEAEEQATTPAQAIREIGEVRNGLDAALKSYKSGDKAAADEKVGTAYLEHFEHVEGPLGQRDHELTEELEDAIREELRDKIKAGAPAGEVESLIGNIKKDLQTAEAALR